MKKGNGTLSKLIYEDAFYEEILVALSDLRRLITRSDKAIGSLEGEVTEPPRVHFRWSRHAEIGEAEQRRGFQDADCAEATSKTQPGFSFAPQ